MGKTLKIGGAILLALMAIIFVTFTLRNSIFSLQVEKGDVGSGGKNMPSRMIFSAPESDSVMMEKSVGSQVSLPSYASDEISSDLPVLEKKIRKDGNMNLKVDDADKVAEKISGIAKDNGGEIFSSNFYQSSDNVKSGTVVVRVPVANFEKTFAEIKRVASLVIQESTSGDDMTEQYVDLQAQLKNKRAEEEQLARILAGAQKIDDVLAVTKELSRVRGNIEQLQTRVKYLESQTDMSTISVSVSEDENITVVDSWRPLQVVKESFNGLIKGLQGFANFLIRLVIIAIPFLLIWAALILVLYSLGKKVYFKFKNKQQI